MGQTKRAATGALIREEIGQQIEAVIRQRVGQQNEKRVGTLIRQQTGQQIGAAITGISDIGSVIQAKFAFGHLYRTYDPLFLRFLLQWQYKIRNSGLYVR
ncbi:hypothetical protein VE23_14010 [Paenibacillus sp. D9]|nr:hypothetical protein VE23_14010 [Paenibacillus sp. D9]CDN45596.1 hypothetical protein BN871_ID_00070 [Paenibacillus sp. P22]